jgi:hypothetical protein
MFKVSVTNESPHLNTKIKDIVVVVEKFESFFISEATDREGQKIIFQAYEKG